MWITYKVLLLHANEGGLEAESRRELSELAAKLACSFLGTPFSPEAVTDRQTVLIQTHVFGTFCFLKMDKNKPILLEMGRPLAVFIAHDKNWAPKLKKKEFLKSYLYRYEPDIFHYLKTR